MIEKIILFVMLGIAALAALPIAITPTDSRHGTMHRIQAWFFLIVIVIAIVVIIIRHG